MCVSIQLVFKMGDSRVCLHTNSHSAQERGKPVTLNPEEMTKREALEDGCREPQSRNGRMGLEKKELPGVRVPEGVEMSVSIAKFAGMSIRRWPLPLVRWAPQLPHRLTSASGASFLLLQRPELLPPKSPVHLLPAALSELSAPLHPLNACACASGKPHCHLAGKPDLTPQNTL